MPRNFYYKHIIGGQTDRLSSDAIVIKKAAPRFELGVEVLQTSALTLKTPPNKGRKSIELKLHYICINKATHPLNIEPLEESS